MISSREAAELVPPIILVDGQDVMMFVSVSDAERFPEPWAVEDGSAERFDSKARKLAFYVEPPPQGGILSRLFGARPGRVRISAEGLVEEERLRAVLRRYLSIRQPDSAAKLSSKSLEELVAEAYRFAKTR